MSFIAGLYMKVGRDQFAEALLKSRPENISRTGLERLFDYLDDQANEEEKPMAVNPVEVVCTYAESSEDDLRAEYDFDPDTTVEEFLAASTVFVGKYVFPKTGDCYYLYEKF